MESPSRSPGPGAASAQAEVLWAGPVTPGCPLVLLWGVACEASGPAESEKRCVTFAASGTCGGEERGLFMLTELCPAPLDSPPLLASGNPTLLTLLGGPNRPAHMMPPHGLTVEGRGGDKHLRQGRTRFHYVPWPLRAHKVGQMSITGASGKAQSFANWQAASLISIPGQCHLLQDISGLSKMLSGAPYHSPCHPLLPSHVLVSDSRLSMGALSALIPVPADAW